MGHRTRRSGGAALRAAGGRGRLLFQRTRGSAGGLRPVRAPDGGSGGPVPGARAAAHSCGVGGRDCYLRRGRATRPERPRPFAHHTANARVVGRAIPPGRMAAGRAARQPAADLPAAGTAAADGLASVCLLARVTGRPTGRCWCTWRPAWATSVSYTHL